jgi:hypothetical protein
MEARPDIARVLEGLAAVAAAQAQFEQTVRLASTAAALRAAMGIPIPPYEQPPLDQVLDAARATLGAAAFDAAWTAAQATAWERVVDEILAALSRGPAAGKTIAPGKRPEGDGMQRV